MLFFKRNLFGLIAADACRSACFLAATVLVQGLLPEQPRGRRQGFPRIGRRPAGHSEPRWGTSYPRALRGGLGARLLHGRLTGSQPILGAALPERPLGSGRGRKVEPPTRPPPQLRRWAQKKKPAEAAVAALAPSQGSEEEEADWNADDDDEEQDCLCASAGHKNWPSSEDCRVVRTAE